jgi:hypothetical protein
MTAICLIDTSIFVEILNVPIKASRHVEIVNILEDKIKAAEFLFLPLATILETGNHIAQNGDGNQRRDCAERFVKEVKKALEGTSPFSPIKFLDLEALQNLLNDFPDSAMAGYGLGDASIIQDWRRLCRQNAGRRVYIWSLDKQLASYDRKPSI